MNIKILASTKEGNVITKDEAMIFSGKAAGICYMPEDIDTLFSESETKTIKRAKMTLESGHHSVYDHVVYNLALVDIPKILAMVLNNEKMYTTSEKSARYTKMKPSEKEEALYLKWIDIFKKVIVDNYSFIEEKQIEKLAMENARYLISVFTPATTMEYTVSIRQLNYIMHWFENFIANEYDNSFNILLKQSMKEFNEQLKELYIPELNTEVKGRKLSLFDERVDRQEEFGENYSINYYGTFTQFAQAQRHRTISYSMRLSNKVEYFVPPIIKDTDYENEWLEDISSLAELFPQGMLVKINERGTAENFILKCEERLCGCAQLEIQNQTKKTLDRYIEETRITNKEVNEYLLKYSKGPRCTFEGYKCAKPCVWGPNNAFNRLI